MNRIQINVENCKGCGLCVEACRQEVIKISDQINTHGYYIARITNEEECISCANCAEVCPDIAIEVWR